MFGSRPKRKYERLATEDKEANEDEISQTAILSRRSTRRRWSMLLVAVVLIAALLYTSIRFLDKSAERSVHLHFPHCHNPSVRREWRSLADAEKETYISAVQCLMQQPSIFKAGTSFYDDFIFGHSKTGSYAHYAAAFLPWHRLYVHVYEQAVRGKCGYEGPLPYWDWTLDSQDLTKSPIWYRTHGFGGNGATSSPETLHGGRCVTDGPFANTTRAWSALSEGHSHDVTYEPHCMSREFASGDIVNKLQHLISPEHVEETLSQPDYNAFFQAFENGAHNAIPQFIRGDFLTFTAPNDPVFFLHHTQVDRLWWLWQMRSPGTRLQEFQGPSEDFRFYEAASTSSRSDVLPMAGLAEDRRVEDVMDAAGGFLCYRY